MSTFTLGSFGAGIAPFIAVPDITKSIGYYRDVLGFHVDMIDSGFALVSRDGATIMLQEHPGPVKHSPRWAAYIWVPDIEMSLANLTSRSVKFTQPVASTPWGTREFQVEDHDGYQLRFSQIGSIE